MAHTLLHFVSVLALLNLGQSNGNQYKKYTSSLSFTLESTINTLGHRVVTVNGLGETPDTNGVVVAVDHWTEMYNGREVVGLKLNVTTSTSSVQPAVNTDMENYISECVVRPSSIALKCLTGYELVPDVGCYRFVTKDFDFQQAKSYCESQNGHLAIPDTEEELRELKARMSVRYNVQPWVGIYKSDGTWITVKGNGNFVGWAKGEPKNAGDCVGLACVGLRDFKCNERGSSICEQNLL